MFFQKTLRWLTLIGALAATYITLPKWWIKTGNGQVWQLDKDLPQWALGLVVVIVLLLIFKVVTHIIFKILMWIMIAVLVIIALNSFNLPVLQWLGLATGH